MPNPYDRIIKENSDFLMPIIAQWFGIDLSRVEVLKDKLQLTLEREGDFCVKVLHDNPENNYIFHIEFQATPYYKRYRGLFYRGFLSYTHDLPVRQVVVYVGNEPHYIGTHLEEYNLIYDFDFVDFKRRSYREFLYKDTPEEIITTILCDFEGEDPEKIVAEIIAKIQTFERHRVNKCAIQLQILSNLRNLQALVIKYIKKMPLLIDLSNDPFFVEQFQIREAEGEAKGEAKGKAEGKTEVIIGLLETGRFSVEEIAVFAKVPIAFVLEAQKQYFAQQALLPKKK